MEANGETSRRRHIVLTAARLFREKGYERATIRDLAGAVDLQSGSLFHYFNSKDDILFAVIADAMNSAITHIREALSHSQDPRTRLKLLIRAELETVCGETANGMNVAAFEWRKLSEKKQQHLIAIRQEYEDLWQHVLKEAESAGLLILEATLLRKFLNGALSWTSTWFREGGGKSLDDLAEAALTMAVRSGANTQSISN